ncbi:PIN domain-containing protein [uncultured Holdemanella sp.]|uniref:PIN domain-containing protein n=1 Tax=uncultured Holdemanella sp. TaxID=1763549 RepID=UPI00344BD004
MDNHTIIVSVSAITDIFYIARKYIGNEQAKECIRNLLDLIKISDTRGADIEKALSSDISDFEDAVVSAIAERQKAKYILTRNTKDFEKSKILSITPHDYLNINK